MKSYDGSVPPPAFIFSIPMFPGIEDTWRGSVYKGPMGFKHADILTERLPGNPDNLGGAND
jgi:hypothetical protein